ncbi:MAG: 1-phosphofructokinase family hexose kinase [Clostridia bacterium]|jgi:1-phosphofructokinase family hexose kinase|nr:1-phosphofructokinase family hexose kinase [Clostridia bacterium]
MILTVCLSPSVDVTIELDSLNTGKVNVVKSKTLSFTGKALNVAIGVARLGGEAYATGFMYNDNGMMFERALDKEGVPFSFVWNSGRVRENYKCIDKHSMLTEINDVGEQVGDEKLYELLQAIRNLSSRAEVTVISGSLPRGVDPTYYRELFRAVDPRSLRIVDAEGARLFAALEAGIDLVKPNLEELEFTLGRQIKDKDDMLAGCRELLERGAKAVLLSLGKDGAVITDGTQNYYCKSINVAVNSTVGAGDGMVAAAATALKQGAPLKDILRAGVAAGTATVTTFGTISFTKSKYEEILAGLSVTEF